jgi:hypothetical protein
MNRYIYILLITLWYLTVCAQVNESFNDTALNASSISWIGQLNDFKINVDHQLQSIGNANGISALFAPISLLPSMEWQCWLKLNFAPSETNKLRIYLHVNDTVLSKADAHYLEIGDNGSTDAIKFYRQINGKSTLLAEGISGAVANDPSIVRMKINRNQGGTWTLSTDYLGGQNYIEEWTISDTAWTIQNKQYFGIQCIYTSTRKDKFLFDDIFIHKDSVDHDPIKITRVSSDSNQVNLYLNKAVDSLSAFDEENYVVSNGMGQPRQALLLKDTIIQLTFARNLPSGKYDVICKTFKDKAGNSTFNLKASWVHSTLLPIKPYELLINEMMIDPTPVVGLPAYEFIEVVNHTSHSIDLSAVTLRFESNTYPIDTSSLMLNAGEYIILCDNTAYESLKAYGKIYNMKKMPSLRNTNGTIGLYDSKGTLIHEVIYEDTWYRDTRKKDGGWSLEMINPDNVCDGSLNWIVSGDPSGGTPGKVNSVFNTTYAIPLTMDSITLVTDKSILLHANKPIQLKGNNSFELLPSISLNATAVASNKVLLSLSTGISSGVIYHLKINVNDCLGRPLPSIDTTLAKVEDPDLNDLVINEILFNPRTNGSDFIELYNRSNKIIGTKGMIISNELTGKQSIISANALILPDTYWVVSPKTDIILTNYSVLYPGHLIMNSLPTLPDDHGQISIWSKNKVLIDSCTYDQSYHNGLLNSKDGVTLERIDPDAPPLAANWHSAAGISGYGTPTSKNSVSKSIINVSSSFNLKNRVFTPDDNGVDDQLEIRYTLAHNGYLARIDIFDDQGRPVKRLANNLTLATNGSVEWDGRDDKDRSCPSGIYIISILAIHETKTPLHDRIACVLQR